MILNTSNDILTSFVCIFVITSVYDKVISPQLNFPELFNRDLVIKYITDILKSQFDIYLTSDLRKSPNEIDELLRKKFENASNMILNLFKFRNVKCIDEFLFIDIWLLIDPPIRDKLAARRYPISKFIKLRSLINFQ